MDIFTSQYPEQQVVLDLELRFHGDKENEERQCLTLDRVNSKIEKTSSISHIGVSFTIERFRDLMYPGVKVDLISLPSSVRTLKISGGSYGKGATAVFPSARRLTSLDTLTLENIALSRPAALMRSCELRRLEMYSVGIPRKGLPSQLWRIPRLQSLGFNKISLPYLPDGIEAATQIESIGIANSGLKELPQGISSLENLNVMSLEDNELSDLPVLAPGFKYAYCGNNRFTEIPEWMLSRGFCVNLHGNPGLRDGMNAPVMNEMEFSQTERRADFSRNNIRAVPPWLKAEHTGDFMLGHALNEGLPDSASRVLAL